MKICEECLISKQEEDFYRLNRNKDGRENKCKVCRKIRNNLWYKNNKEKHAQSSIPASIKRRFGITYTEYKEWFKDGKCNICEVVTSKLKLDHCHKTGKIRGVLCHNCNVTLGLCKDNKDVLRKAAKYIEDNERL